MMLARLADTIENMAQLDFTEQPAVKFRDALQAAAADSIPLKVLIPTILKMKVEICEFDANSADWNRIIKAYALILKKIYGMYGYDMIHLDGLSIQYSV